MKHQGAKEWDWEVRFHESEEIYQDCLSHLKHSSLGRVAVFLIFPAVVGGLSLLTALLQGRHYPEHELNLDRDFIYPFMLALSLSILIGFQTRGFSKEKPESLIAWPKVKKQKKIVHKHVVVGDKKND